MLQKEVPGRHLKKVCRNFPGKERAENYGEIVQDLISSCSAMGCNMSLQFNFMHFHLDFFVKTWEPSPMNKAKSSVRTISQMGKTYSGKCGPNMLNNYCKSHVRETPTSEYKTKWIFNEEIFRS